MTKYVNTKLSNFPAKVRQEFVVEYGEDRVQVEFAHHVFGYQPDAFLSPPLQYPQPA